MKVVAIIQARMGSTRLPGKVLRTLGGATVLAHVLGRAMAVPGIDEVVVATSTQRQDDPVEKEARKCGAGVFRGSEADVLSRYYEAARLFHADVIVRITSDCPLLDPDLVEQMVSKFLGSRMGGKKLDYLSNALTRSYPRGLDAEVFTFAALESTQLTAKQSHEREHVTPYIYQHPASFAVEEFVGDRDFSSHRWTLDTPKDYEFLQAVFNLLGASAKNAGMHAVLGLLAKHPHLVWINQQVRQKALNE
ncbi:MAG: glycosyltransferase family protein [Burkholderiales bacterium]